MDKKKAERELEIMKEKEELERLKIEKTKIAKIKPRDSNDDQGMSKKERLFELFRMVINIKITILGSWMN